jgi:hypothetical protein
MQNHLRATLLGAALAGGLFVSLSSSPASACPGSERARGNAQAAQADQTTQVAAVQASGNTECAYSRSHGGCNGLSFGSKLLAASLPAGLLAFGLGWATGGRRKRNRDEA